MAAKCTAWQLSQRGNPGYRTVNHLRLVHPTLDDVPSCFRLMELLMVCHGTVLFLKLVAIYAETFVPGEILVTTQRILMLHA